MTEIEAMTDRPARLLKQLSLAIALTSTPIDHATAAPILDGNSLHSWCADARNSPQGTACMAYLRGVYDALFVAAIRKGGEFCVPDGVTVSQFTDVVAKYLRDNPQRRHNLATQIVEEALQQAFPGCSF